MKFPFEWNFALTPAFSPHFLCSTCILLPFFIGNFLYFSLPDLWVDLAPSPPEKNNNTIDREEERKTFYSSTFILRISTSVMYLCINGREKSTLSVWKIHGDKSWSFPSLFFQIKIILCCGDELFMLQPFKSNPSKAN